MSQAAQYSKVHGEIHARGRMIGTGKEGEDVGLPRVAWRKEGGDSSVSAAADASNPVEGSAASAASPSTGTTKRTPEQRLHVG